MHYRPVGAIADGNMPGSYDDAVREREPALGLATDFDATRIVEDFDLPVEGFETHVFSTAELGERSTAELGDPGVPYMATDGSISYGPASHPRSELVSADGYASLASTLDSRAHDLLSELVGLDDVVFAKLIGPKGETLVTAGDESADRDLGSDIAAIMAAAGKEVRDQGFGETSTVALESTKAALLISPVHAGSVLVVLVSNPARLGVLRRQVRKPITGLRSLLM
jgi:predicted regulator of Ras-like GTPase activity (Roadblock/LC7/MglB family)